MANSNNNKLVAKEQYRHILNAVLNRFFISVASSSYLAVYLTIPLLIAPFAKFNMMDIKLENWPTKATPAGPVITATILPIKNPEHMRIKVIIAEKKDVLISVKIDCVLQ